MKIQIELDTIDVRRLKALLELCREEDLLNLQAYDSISKANQIDDAWKALPILDRICSTPTQV